jgi:hypothetical protein
MREGVGPDGNWMIDLHQKFDFHEAVEVAASLNRIDRSSSRIRCARSSSGRSCRNCD